MAYPQIHPQNGVVLHLRWQQVVVPLPPSSTRLCLHRSVSWIKLGTSVGACLNSESI